MKQDKIKKPNVYIEEPTPYSLKDNLEELEERLDNVIKTIVAMVDTITELNNAIKIMTGDDNDKERRLDV